MSKVWQLHHKVDVGTSVLSLWSTEEKAKAELERLKEAHISSGMIFDYSPIYASWWITPIEIDKEIDPMWLRRVLSNG